MTRITDSETAGIACRAFYAELNKVAESGGVPSVPDAASVARRALVDEGTRRAIAYLREHGLVGTVSALTLALERGDL